AMGELRVEVNEVGEDEPSTRAREVRQGVVDAVLVRDGISGLRQPTPGEEVPDLADAVRGHTGSLEPVQERIGGRLGREVAPFRPTDEGAGPAVERPGDDAADGVLTGEEAPGGARPLVQPLER